MTTPPTSQVSVVMPVLNAARFLPDALASVAAQTLQPLEVILVDGPSTDATPEIARAFPNSVYLRQTGSNMWNALNEGVAAARGEYISFLSSDDIWMPDKLRIESEFLDAHPDTLVVFAHVKFQLVEGAAIPASWKSELFQGVHPTFMTEVLMARRTLFDRIGNFPEQYRVVSDMEWFTRIFENNIPSHMLPDVVTTKRVHANNLSSAESSGRDYTRELLQIFRDSILRKRQLEQNR